MPLYRLTGTSNITFQNLSRHLTSDTSGTDDQVLMILLQLFMVCSRTVIKTVNPRVAHQLDQVLIATIVLSQHDQVIATQILLGFLQSHVAAPGHIHLTSEDGFKWFQSFLLPLLVDTNADIMKLLHAEHITMIGDGHALHAVSDSLVDQFLDTGLSIQYRIICVYV